MIRDYFFDGDVTNDPRFVIDRETGGVRLRGEAHNVVLIQGGNCFLDDARRWNDTLKASLRHPLSGIGFLKLRHGPLTPHAVNKGVKWFPDTTPLPAAMSAYHAIGRLSAEQLEVLAEPEVLKSIDALFSHHRLISLETNLGGTVEWWFLHTQGQRLSLDALYALLTEVDHFVDVSIAACAARGIGANQDKFRAGSAGLESGAPISTGLIFRK